MPLDPHHFRSALLLLVLHVCVLLVPAAMASSSIESRDLTGTRIVSLVNELRRVGYDLSYSQVRLTRRLKVLANPPPGDPLTRLKAVLGDHDLELVQGTTDKSWLVVERQRPAGEYCVRWIDAVNRRPIVGVQIFSERLAFTPSDERGLSCLSEPFPSVVLNYTHPRYESASLRWDVKDATRSYGHSEILKELVPITTVEEVLVTSGRYHIRQDSIASPIAVSGSAVSSRPLLGGDPLRVLATVPGVSSLGLSADANIRGGAREDLLVRFNDVELIEPYHLKDFESVFSALNPSVVDFIEIYTSNFPVRFGNRMSGVFDVQTSQNLAGSGFEADLSLFNASVFAFGQLGDATNWNGSFRRGNLDLIANVVNPGVGDPKYVDFHSQLTRELEGGRALDLGVLGSKDDIVLESLDDGIGTSAQSEYDSYYGWLHLRGQSDALRRRSSIVLSRIENSRSGFSNEVDLDESNGTVSDNREFTLYRLEQAFETLQGGQSVDQFGWGVQYQRGSYEYQANATRGLLSQLYGIPSDIDREISRRPSGVSANAYYSRAWHLSDRIAAMAGLRLDAQDYTFEGFALQVSPRTSIAYAFDDAHNLHLSAGRYHQPEAIYELQVQDNRTEFQNDQFTDQVSLGYQFSGSSGVRLRAEMYYKAIHSPDQRFENLANPLVLLPEISPDRVELHATKARAVGMELSISYVPSASFQTWINFASSRAQDRINGVWVSRRWDERQRLGAGVVYTGANWTASLLATWHPGWRTTELPERVADFSAPVPLDLYGAKLGQYFSLDAKFSYTWDWPRNSLKVYADVTNITNRTNVGAIEYEIDPLGDQFEVERNNETLLPLIPSIGLVWYFN